MLYSALACCRDDTRVANTIIADPQTSEEHIMGRRTQKLISKATELMEPGEQVELTTLARLGSAAAKIATGVGGLVGGAVAGMLGGGEGFTGYKGDVYIVLTDRQMLFFSASQATGGPDKHLASIRRNLVTSSEPKSGLFVKLRIAVEGMSQPLDLTFPPLPPSLRARARQLAAALPKSTA
jgi:hypothetical protein